MHRRLSLPLVFLAALSSRLPSTLILQSSISPFAFLAFRASHYALFLVCDTVLTWLQPCIQNPSGGEIVAFWVQTAPPCLLKIARYVF
jgi:hypothetical protein